MSSSVSDILSAVQSGVIALNNLATQIKGSFNNILSRFVTDEANIATNTADILLRVTIASMSASLGASGYQKFQSGLIIQWGTTVQLLDVGGNCSFAYPIVFPNAIYREYCINGDSTAGPQVLLSIISSGGFPTTANMAVHGVLSNTAAVAAGVTVRIDWLALGS